MNGNIEISKKSALMIVAVLSVFTAADFVSMIDIETSGGIVIEKETQIVGSVVFRMDDINPSTIYGGTWQLLAKDSTLNFGDGSIQSGVASGNNNPVVPIPLHSHGMNHDHPAVNTNTAGNHHHDGGIGMHSNYNNEHPASSPFGATNRVANFNGFQFNAWVHNADFPRTSTAGNHTHSMDLPNFVGNTANAGVSNATLDVRGQIITINVWRRIS